MKAGIEREVESSGKKYVSNGSGLYGWYCEPGGPEDTTAGKIGIHWVCPQYDKGPDVDEIRGVLDLFFAAKKEDEEARQAGKERAAKMDDVMEARNIANGMCPKCGTWCYGSCEG